MPNLGSLHLWVGLWVVFDHQQRPGSKRRCVSAKGLVIIGLLVVVIVERKAQAELRQPVAVDKREGPARQRNKTTAGSVAASTPGRKWQIS